MDWSPLIVQQAEDRCHRVGQKSSVLVQYLFFGNTIDEIIDDRIIVKHKINIDLNKKKRDNSESIINQSSILYVECRIAAINFAFSAETY